MSWVCQRFSIFSKRMSRKRDKPSILNTFTTVGVWNGTIFYLAAPIAQISRPPLHVCQRFIIFCRHMSRNRDKPSILNTFATVGVWNGTIFYFAAPFSISPKFCVLPYMCVDNLAFFVGTWVELETNQLSLNNQTVVDDPFTFAPPKPFCNFCTN